MAECFPWPSSQADWCWHRWFRLHWILLRKEMMMEELMPFLYYLYLQYGDLFPSDWHSCRHHIWQLNLTLGGRCLSIWERLLVAIGRKSHHLVCLPFSSAEWGFFQEKGDGRSFWVFHVSSYFINLQWGYYFICTHHYYLLMMIIFSYFNPSRDYFKDSDAPGNCCCVDLVL